MNITYRKKGLPKRLRQIPGGVLGLVSACNVEFAEGYPVAKVAFFKTPKALRDFYKNTLPKYRGAGDIRVDSLGKNCRGVVNKLNVHITKFHPDGTETERVEVDRNYFCFVGLVEGYLTAEILCHEAVHVGFAWDFRTKGCGVYPASDNPEENVCYPAGHFLDVILTFIKTEKLREL